MKIIKNAIVCFIFFISIISFDIQLKANNIQISNVQITEKNSIEHWVNISFNLSWDNNWRINTGASNWGAAWVFVKYRLADGIWRHATLSSLDIHHIMPANVTGKSTSDGKGLFIYDSRVNIGDVNFSATGLVIRWNYGSDLVSDFESKVDIKIFGIEMVYIPQLPYYLGSGGSEDNAFYTYPEVLDPYLVNSENVDVSASNGSLYYNFSVSTDGGDRGGPVPLSFPKGFNGFYMMRYEISQQQYVDFLNTLTRAQQISRVASNINGSNIITNYVMSGSNTVIKRNGISCPVAGNGTTAPVNFYCDYNANGIGNEANDGQNIACNYLNWADGLAFLDWAGLRPMTELEFEKACRGNITPVANEFAWGSTILLRALGIINPGSNSETASNAGNGLCNYDDLEIGIGPLRCGFAAISTDRVQSANSYYGVSNLSDNLSERCITIGSPQGRAYTGLNGDGSIITNVSGWPDINGQSLRGGNYLRKSYRMTISDRTFGTYPIDSRYDNIGWRGIRSAE